MHNLIIPSQFQATYQDAAKKELIGSSVITRYNNKTYKIDDIDFSSSPEASFLNHKGESTTFVEYYKAAYNIDIKDTKQPLIINFKKNPLDKEADPVKLCLVPELCFACGLTEQQSADFR